MPASKLNNISQLLPERKVDKIKLEGDFNINLGLPASKKQEQLSKTARKNSKIIKKNFDYESIGIKEYAEQPSQFYYGSTNNVN